MRISKHHQSVDDTEHAQNEMKLGFPQSHNEKLMEKLPFSLHQRGQIAQILAHTIGCMYERFFFSVDV